VNKLRVQETTPVRVVGIGASAGGLDAMKKLLATTPVDTGLAFVVLQHLAASQIGLLRDALESSTKMPVVDISSGTRIEPDHVYVAPPNVSVAILRGALLLKPAKGGERIQKPIDELFISLAAVLGARSVGVVLSGTANDGSEGLRSMRAAGGITFAQDPTTAQFDEMPRSAIGAGAVSIVLPPGQIGAELGRLRPDQAAPDSATTRSSFDQILDSLRNATGIDFSNYKRATIERRISRRMAEHKVGSLEGYVQFLAGHPGEAATLYEDLLIHVTEFFRDRAILDQLTKQVFPEILRSLPAGEPIRIWVPGCSTGQEPYSLAMLLTEFLEMTGHRRQIQIFGTDLSEKSIEVARAAQYPDEIISEVGQDRLDRFFTRVDGGWRLKKEIRERCVFVRHDLTSDPPFSKLDLISCRNVLIYLGPSLQQGLIPMFHYALNQPGFLIIGRAESVAGFDTLFSPLGPGLPIYSRLATAGRLALPLAGRYGRSLHERKPGERARSASDVQRDVDHVLLARYAPACVLIDGDGEILQYRGRTGPFLEPTPGQPHHHLVKMARAGLGPEIRSALQRAQREDAAVRRENIQLRDGGQARRVNIEVVPLPGVAAQDRHFIVVFEEANPDDVKPAARRTKGRLRVTAAERNELAQVRQELVATKEYLSATLAQHTTTSEELGVANEELQSMNEELLSMNEELQTAKEELQSTNEELETVNDELQRGNERLKTLNDDLVNLLASVDIAIIIVDLDQQVRRFTPRARTVINLIESDIGRKISDLRPNLEIPDLSATIVGVIESLAMSETEVSDVHGACYRMQVRPYRTTDNKIDGAVISFVDISVLKRNIEEKQRARDYAAAIVDTVPNPIVVLDLELRIESANRAFHLAFGTSPAEVAGRTVFEIGAGSWHAADVDRLRRALERHDSFDDLMVSYEVAGETRVMLINCRVLPGAPKGMSLLVGMLEITERVRAEQDRAKLHEVEEAAAKAVAVEKDAFLNAVSHELRTPLNAILLWTELLRRDDLDPERHRRAIETIEHSARAEARLIDDLLDLALSRSPDNILTVNVEPVNPVPIVEAALDAVRTEAEAKEVAIETALDDELTVEADPHRLHQITWNLAANAIKFTPKGGRVSVSLSKHDGTVELRVEDTGKGISREFLPLVFEPFRQHDQSATRGENGLGIGLALVRHLVERQGGTVSVASSGEGRGATFTVRLPRTP
jgi:two-component system CheB/CheR fusion protein